jgi:hypothetical protein
MEPIRVFIGYEQTNSNPADLSAAWQATEHANASRIYRSRRCLPWPCGGVRDESCGTTKANTALTVAPSRFWPTEKL